LTKNKSQRLNFLPIFGFCMQVVAEDIDGDGSVELIAQDVSGNVVCYSSSGAIVWETSIDMTRPSGARVVDINGDGAFEVMLSTEKG
jgi:hypothetical protein